MPDVADRDYSTISYDTRLVDLAYRLTCHRYNNADQWRCITLRFDETVSKLESASLLRGSLCPRSGDVLLMTPSVGAADDGGIIK